MGSFLTKDGLSLHYDEYGAGDRVINDNDKREVQKATYLTI